VSGASRSLAVLVVAAPVAGLAAWLLRDAPRAEIGGAARAVGAPPAAAPSGLAPKEAPPPREDGGAARRLEARLDRAIELARDFEPLVPRLLEGVAEDADRAGQAELAARARRELAAYAAASRSRDLGLAARLRDEARALAKEGSPAAVARFVEAAEAARVTDGPEAARGLEAELEAHRFELRRLAAALAVDRDRAGQKDDGTTDDDPRVRAGFAAFGQGDGAAEGPLVALLSHRADVEHKAGTCALAVRDLALARSVTAEVAARLHDESHRPLAELLADELRCRLEAAARSSRLGDGSASLGFLDMAELVKLDPRAPASPRVLYLLGRAFEADGRRDEARDEYLAAIGVATWLPEGAPTDLLRWFARCRAAHRDVTVSSPGVGKQWRRIDRPGCVIYEELGEAGLGMGGRVDRARQKAIDKLRLGEPVRAQAFKPVVFVYASEARYRRDAAPSVWAGGHAEWSKLEDGLGSEIVVYLTPGLDDVLAHEWTHVIVNDGLKGARLPSWAVEGVASWVEEGDARKWRLKTAAENLRRLPAWRVFLETRTDPRYVSASPEAATMFYAQALLAFETAEKRLGSAGSVLLGAVKILAEQADPFEALGFKNGEDFEKAAGVVIPEEKPVTGQPRR
jgi:tetratricopeptide (TPR) repeat protein